MAKNKCGQTCEVWSRCVGYHRPVTKWNRGLREQYKNRKTYKNVTSPQIVTKAS